MLEVQLAEAHANVAATESHETAMAEALKEAEDRHTQQLEDAYLVTRAKRRTLDTERQGDVLGIGKILRNMARMSNMFSHRVGTKGWSQYCK